MDAGLRTALARVQRPRSTHTKNIISRAKRQAFAAGKWALLLLTLLVGSVLAITYARLPIRPVESGPDSSTTPQWPQPSSFDNADWKVIREHAGKGLMAPGALAERFRLAGTFFAFSGVGEADQPLRKAIIDDLEKDAQHLVQEDDWIERFKVSQIYRDRVTMQVEDRLEELHLSFSGPLAGPEPVVPKEQGIKRFEDMPALERNRFGKRIGELRWVFKREALLEYYNELVEDTERAANI